MNDAVEVSCIHSIHIKFHVGHNNCTLINSRPCNGMVSSGIGDAEHVIVPDCNCLHNQDEYRVLLDTVSPLAESHHHGIDHYMVSVSLVEDMVSSH